MAAVGVTDFPKVSDGPTVTGALLDITVETSLLTADAVLGMTVPSAVAAFTRARYDTLPDAGAVKLPTFHVMVPEESTPPSYTSTTSTSDGTTSVTTMLFVLAAV
jgi:hypothetical protein